MVTFLQF